MARVAAILLLGASCISASGCPRGRGRSTSDDAGGVDVPGMDVVADMVPNDGPPPIDMPLPIDRPPPVDMPPMMDVPAPDLGCTNDLQCDDGLRCNGVERCVAGRCTAGTTVRCDDGVACTFDGCEEPAGTCASVPDNVRCPTGQMCDRARGCIAGCSESPCRLASPQCGCLTGQSCYGDTATLVRVCHATGAGLEGQACVNDDWECGTGLGCYVITGNTPSCRRFCAMESDCTSTGAGSICLNIPFPGAMTPSTVSVCSRSCDPAARTGCPAMTKCVIFQEAMGAMRFGTDCSAPIGTGGHLASCTDDSSCQAGFQCFDTGMGTECLQLCRVGGAACPSARTCQTLDVTIAGTTYGVCV